MKYMMMFVLSLTVLLFAACSSGGGVPTELPEPKETEPAIETSFPTEASEPTDEAYPVDETTPEPVDAYPDGVPTAETIDSYPEQNALTTSSVVSGAAYPSEVNLSDITSEPASSQPLEAPKPGVPDNETAVAHLASQDLAERLDLDISEIIVVHIEAVEWPDASLDCPAPGFSYAQVITAGYHMALEAEGVLYDYHTDLNGNIILCGENSQPVE